MNRIVEEDFFKIFSGLSEEERADFRGSSVLITGGAGFLGFTLTGFLAEYRDKLGIRDLICLDLFKSGLPAWLKIREEKGQVRVYPFDVTKDRLDSVPEAAHADFVLHMASIASPVYYRLHPIETLDANVPFRLIRRPLLEKYLEIIPASYSMPNLLMTALTAAGRDNLLFRDISFGARQNGKNSMNLRKIIAIGRESVSVFRDLGGSRR